MVLELFALMTGLHETRFPSPVNNQALFSIYYNGRKDYWCEHNGKTVLIGGQDMQSDISNSSKRYMKMLHDVMHTYITIIYRCPNNGGDICQLI